jgi:NADH-quinone oxidoreductase subunit H
MFFLAEYGNMIMMSLIYAELFLGGWSGPSFVPPAAALSGKALIFCVYLVVLRATVPRYRYDQLMDIGWKIFLPLATGLLLFVIGVIVAFDAAPAVLEIPYPRG